MMRRGITLAAAIFALSLTGVPATGAPIVDLDILSGSDWVSTDDSTVGGNWIAGNFAIGDGDVATAPYPNSVTTPDDIVSGTSAELMWHCDTAATCQDGGTVTGRNGPEEAWFRFVFDLPSNLASPRFDAGATAFIIADDLFEFYVNGTFVGAEDLDGNQDASNQPVPVELDFAAALQPRENIIAIRALDGNLLGSCGAGGTVVSSQKGPWCKVDRAFEYVFVDGNVLVTRVPEPTTFALLAIGLAAMGFLGRRPRMAAKRSK